MKATADAFRFIEVQTEFEETSVPSKTLTLTFIPLSI